MQSSAAQQDQGHSEFSQDIQALKEDPNYACRFPARAARLSVQFKIEYKKCTEVEDWKLKIKAEKVALVHVGQYVSNPSSAFGHSFLLFESTTRPLNMQMAFSNAAQIPDQVGAWDYITKGLFGGFPSGYSIEPFYIKIQEYTAIENRDMWIYHLNFTADEVEQLLNHLWELNNQTPEPYYFLDRNCSVNVYNALAAIRKDLDFFPDNPLYVLPVEALQKTAHLVTHKTYIPSLREKIVQRQRLLAQSQNKDLEQAEINLDLYEFKKSQNGGELSGQDAKDYSEQLIKRSKLGTNTEPFVFKAPAPPDGAHATFRLAVGLQKKEEQHRAIFSLAPFYHSVVQKTDGYLPNSEIVVLKGDIVQDGRNRFSLDTLTLFKMFNLPASSDFDSQMSFRVLTEIESKTDCFDCHFLSAEVAAGRTVEIGESHALYGLIGVLEGQEQILLPELVTGAVMQVADLRINFEYQRVQDFFSRELTENRWTVKAGLPVFKNVDLEVMAKRAEQVSTYSAILSKSW